MTTEKITRPLDAHRAARFVLAVGADNHDEATRIVDTAVTDQPLGLGGFVYELAAITIGLGQKLEGDDGPCWR